MTQADNRQLIEDLRIVLGLARDAMPEKSHAGSCSPDTSCDTDCMLAYYCGVAAGRVHCTHTYCRNDRALLHPQGADTGAEAG